VPTTLRHFPRPFHDTLCGAAMTPLDAARHYLERGWSVVALWWPLPHGCACPRGVDCPSAAKHPCLPAWRHLQTERPQADDLTAWWNAWPRANVGVVTGTVSQLAVIDSIPGAAAMRRRTSSMPLASGCRSPPVSSRRAGEGSTTTSGLTTRYRRRRLGTGSRFKRMGVSW
jgi:hypothetical protein